MKHLVIAAALLCLPPAAEAACSGSRTEWKCTAGTTPSQVNSALGRAADGATLTFAAGSYRWGGNTRIDNFSLNKGVTLVCETPPPSSAPWGAATSGGCNVATSATVIELPRGGRSDKLYRISGFNFTGSGTMIHFCASGSCGKTSLRSIRIDHNTMNRSSGTNAMINLSDTLTRANFEGVIDHNRFLQAAHYNIINLFPQNPAPDVVNGRLGSAHNLFIENNTFEGSTGAGDANGTGCIDFASGVGIVLRYNHTNNCRFVAHGVTHGFGPGNWETYRNTLTKLANSSLGTYRMIHHQGGGTSMVFQNALDANGRPKERSTIAILHYRAFQGASRCAICDGTATTCGDGNRSPEATYRGYPCHHQPGRDYDGTLHPVYAWGNTWEDGTRVPLVIDARGEGGPDYTSQHLKQDRDIYNAVSASAQASPSSPFDGSTGMGFGTLANRPTTCTTTTESADAGRGGVGYWATDEGEWDSSNGATPDGKLYICTATNTWTARYGVSSSGTPYCYPHPLVSGQACGGSGGTPGPVARVAHVLPALPALPLFAFGLLMVRRCAKQSPTRE